MFKVALNTKLLKIIFIFIIISLMLTDLIYRNMNKQRQKSKNKATKFISNVARIPLCRT